MEEPSASMARPAKRTPEVYEMLAERLRRGEYGRSALPSTRKLGAELGVSKFTILRVLRLAEKKGLLSSKGRSRFALTLDGSKKRVARFACIVPAVDLVSSFHWFISIDNVAVQRGGSATLIDYRSPTDPRLTQALSGKHDILFFDPSSSELPPLLLRLLSAKRSRIVPLYEDIPELNLWGIDNMPVEAVDLLIFHLASLGHREIHLVGSLPAVGRQQQLIDRWRSRLKSVGATGVSIFPSKSGTFLPEETHALMPAFLSAHPHPQSILFADLPAAIGGYRALWEAGLKPGTDVAVAALTCEPEAALMTPSLTSLKVPTRETVLEEVVDAILQEKRRTKDDWIRTVLPQIQLLPGESSGQARKTSLS
jgi:DNA-binding LacI/PurR family transcriptional regulator